MLGLVRCASGKRSTAWCASRPEGPVGVGVQVCEAEFGFALDELLLVVGVVVADVGTGGQGRLVLEAERGGAPDAA